MKDQPDTKIWQNVNLTWHSNALGHKMSLPGGTSDERSTWHKDLTKMSTCPKEVMHLATDVSARGDIWPKVNLTQRSDKMSTWPEVVMHLATRYLCLGECIWWKISLTQRSDKMSICPKVVMHLATRCLCFGGYIWPKVNLTWRSDKMSTCLKVVTHLATRGLCLGGTSDQRSVWPKVWPNVNLTRSLMSGGYIWLSAERLSENLNTLWVSNLASQRSFHMKDQQGIYKHMHRRHPLAIKIKQLHSREACPL